MNDSSTPALRTRGFHHITMVSGDADRTSRFYREILELHEVKRTVNFDDPSSLHLYFGDAEGSPGSLVTFFERPEARRGRWGVGGIHHLALAVEDRKEQLRWKRWLMDHGVQVSGPYDRGYFHSIYFTDPDGHILELATLGPGYAFDEAPSALGETFIRPEGHRLRANRDEEEIQATTYPEPVEAITRSMRLQGIHHITGITDDLEEAHEFYTEALGLSLVKRTVNQDDGETRHFFWADYDGSSVTPGSSLTLFGWPGSNYRAREGTGQTHHIAFRARDEEEQLRWQDHLAGLGINVSEVRDRRYFKSIYFQAPDGLQLEIATDLPGFEAPAGDPPQEAAEEAVHE